MPAPAEYEVGINTPPSPRPPSLLLLSSGTFDTIIIFIVFRPNHLALTRKAGEKVTKHKSSHHGTFYRIRPDLLLLLTDISLSDREQCKLSHRGQCPDPGAQAGQQARQAAGGEGGSHAGDCRHQQRDFVTELHRGHRADWRECGGGGSSCCYCH